MAFRVIVSYARADQPPDEATIDRLRERLDAVAPDAAARVALSAVSLDVALTIDRPGELEAIQQAVATADGILGDASVRATAEPT